METDWTVISAAVAAVLALIASIFSALGASRSADVAVQAERRIAAGERKAAERELQRTAAKVEVEVCMTLEVLAGVARTATSNASFYANSGASAYPGVHVEIQQRADRVKALSSLGSNTAHVFKGSDEEINKMQLDLDRALIELSGEKDWALARAAGLSKANQKLCDDILAEERAKGIYARRNADGKLI